MQTRPVVNALQTRYEGQLQVASLNFNERRSERVISELGVRAHPAIVFIREDGRIARRWFGAATEADLRPIVDGLTAR